MQTLQLRALLHFRLQSQPDWYSSGSDRTTERHGESTQRRRLRNEVKQGRQLQSDTSSCRLWVRFSR
jgi:hypothetical protein